MAHHRRSIKRTNAADIAAPIRQSVATAAIGGLGKGMPVLTADKVRTMNAARVQYHAERAMDNALTATRSPVITAGIREFDSGHDCSGYLVAKSVKDSRMSAGQKSTIRLSATRNRNASARPTGGAFKGPEDSSSRAIRSW